MHKSLQEMLEYLKLEFPKIEDKKLIKILFTLKSRSENFKYIWFSRKEAGKKFWISEWTLQKIIYYLRETWVLEFKWQIKIDNWLNFNKCNVYKISEDFKSYFDDLQFFIKKVFEYINPLEFMKKFFDFKFKNWIYSFKAKWQKYIIQTKWKFSWVIYWTIENKIINPYTLLET